MRRLISRVDRAFQNWFPLAYYQLIQRPKIRSQFQTERQLVRGVSLSTSKHPSILFFTTQKCASRYVASLIRSLAQDEGMISVDYDAFVTMDSVPEELRPYSPRGARSKAFQPSGYFYGPIGSFRDIPDRDKYRVVLQLRDPRDVLTSLYFSTAYSHALINRKLVKRRKEARQMSIDDYVLEMAGDYFETYTDYCQELIGKPDILFLKYEHMVADFPNWLSRLSDHVDLAHQREGLKRIIEQADFEVAKEDKYAQRRQITPGDYLRKLKPATINELNKIFARVLDILDYPS